jgi:hypothetical protein
MIYNINKGRNAEIANKSPVLNGYNELIAEVNKNRETMELAEAIVAAIKSCMERNILVYFLEKYASEVLNMLFTEWNLDDAIAVAREEAREDTREECKAEHQQQMQELFVLLESGVPLIEAKKKLGLSQ